MLANVLSWWGSRLGGSAPMTARRTPPRRGVSAAGPLATSEPSSREQVTRKTRRTRRRMGAVMEDLLRGAPARLVCATRGMSSEGHRLRGIPTSPGLGGPAAPGSRPGDDLSSRRLGRAEAISDGSHARTGGPYQGGSDLSTYPERIEVAV